MTQHKFKRLARQINLKPHTLSYLAAEAIICNEESVASTVKRLGVSKQLVHQVVKNIRTADIEFTEVEHALISGEIKYANKLLDELLVK